MTDPAGAATQQLEVTTYYLEMTDPGELHGRRTASPGLEIRRAEVPVPELNRFLYAAVGGNWYWVDRLPWTYQEWLAWVDRAAMETWVATVSGSPAGYFELEAQEGGNVEIKSFGLLPQFYGRGFGAHLLTEAVTRAWEREAARVWVHTCSLDHPHALANYQARGLRVYRQETLTECLPEKTPGPWPGANP